jgi:hypothetical protein
LFPPTNYKEIAGVMKEENLELKEEKKSKILDSGERTKFSTGAVRDQSEMKGRLDLMPMGVINDLLYGYHNERVPLMICKFMNTGNIAYLYQSITSFFTISKEWSSIEDMILDVSIHYEMGLEKYPERNWEKGIPLASYMNSALRHYFKYFRGDKDEPHHRAFIWNIINAIWTVHEFKHEKDPKVAKSIFNLPFAKDWDFENVLDLVMELSYSLTEEQK